jgi:hypothetical protein
MSFIANLLGFSSQNPASTSTTTTLTPTQQKFGDLSQNKNIPEQLEELKGKVQKTMDKNKGELRKFRELSQYNEKLTKSYSANLKIIIDISQLLASYNEFFELFKTKLAEIDQELGIPISSDQFEYMKKLTLDQMTNLEGVFKQQTSMLKKLYTKYGKQKEYDEVDQAERLFDTTKDAGKTAYTTLNPSSASPAPLLGGKKRRTKKRT